MIHHAVYVCALYVVVYCTSHVVDHQGLFKQNRTWYLFIST